MFDTFCHIVVDPCAVITYPSLGNPNPEVANLFVLKRQFCSSPVHIRHTNKRLQNFIVKPKCSLKKKGHRWNKFSIFYFFYISVVYPRYKLCNIFH